MTAELVIIQGRQSLEVRLQRSNLFVPNLDEFLVVDFDGSRSEIFTSAI
jgi:hypothetical protein